MMKETSLRLKNTVGSLARSEGRVVGSEGHERARQWLVDKMEKGGLIPYSSEGFSLSYKYDKQTFCNVVGVVPGTNRRKKPVLIGAHYDSVIAAPCADDNAAAVAIALEVSALLQDRPSERDTVIALFDAEEPPHYDTPSMGSVRFFKDQMQQRGVHAALVMDLVGHDVQIPLGLLPGGDRVPGLHGKGLPIPHLRNLLFVTGAESHPEMSAIVKQARRQDRLPTMFTLNSNVGDMSDHGVFRRNGVPYLFLSCGRWQHYHEPTDTPSRLNYTKMARITAYVESLLRGMSAGTLKSGCPEITDTAELEIKSLRRVFGPSLPLLLKALGVGALRKRGDLDDLAEALLNLGL